MTAEQAAQFLEKLMQSARGDTRINLELVAGLIRSQEALIAKLRESKP